MTLIERFFEELKHLELNPIIEESEILKALDWLEDAYKSKKIPYDVFKLLSDPIQMALNYYIEQDKENYRKQGG